MHSAPKTNEPSLGIDVQVDFQPALRGEKTIAEQTILRTESRTEQGVILTKTNERRASVLRFSSPTEAARIRIFKARSIALDARRLCLVLNHRAHRIGKPAEATSNLDLDG